MGEHAWRWQDRHRAVYVATGLYMLPRGCVCRHGAVYVANLPPPASVKEVTSHLEVVGAVEELFLGKSQEEEIFCPSLMHCSMHPGLSSNRGRSGREPVGLQVGGRIRVSSLHQFNSHLASSLVHSPFQQDVWVYAHGRRACMLLIQLHHHCMLPILLQPKNMDASSDPSFE